MDKRFCIFDMDGTLVDSMHYWKGLGRDYLESLGIRPDEKLLWMVKAMTMVEGAAEITVPPAAAMAVIEAAGETPDYPLDPPAGEYGVAVKNRTA